MVYSMDERGKPIKFTTASGAVHVWSRDNVHTWARENGGPIGVTDEMIKAGVDEFYALKLGAASEVVNGIDPDHCVANIYAAMEAKRREGK